MTIVLSIATGSIITLTVDSAMMKEFSDHREYGTTRKAWKFDGVGCVATWGALTGNKIGAFLESQRIQSMTHSIDIDDVAVLVDNYLKNQYKPHEIPLEDVGYHVVGFNHQREPRLHHVVWGIERPPPVGPNPQQYHWSHHHPRPREISFLYNGRNDLAETVITHFLKELKKGYETRFDLGKPLDQIRFADFVARFAAELTPQVGPPFHTFVITPDNKIGQIRNDKILPIEPAKVKKVLGELGIA